MKRIEQIQEEYKIGNFIFKELYSLSDKEIKEKLKSILDQKYYKVLIQDACECIRTLRNEKPVEIKFYYYDSIIINWTGIFHKYEGEDYKKIIDFNKHFKL